MCMLKVISLALMFLIRLRFPLDKSIRYFLRSRYGNLVVKEFWRFEKVDYSLQKCKLDLTFLLECLQNNIIKKFLNLSVSNLYLKSSRAFHACQIKLPKQEISLKNQELEDWRKISTTGKEN